MNRLARFAVASVAAASWTGLSGCATTPRTSVPAVSVTQATAPASTATPAPEPISARPLQTPPPMDLVLLADPHKPIVSFRLVFHTGSIDDPVGKEGLTELTAEILSQGGTRELSSAELLQALFPMAAELSAHVDKEFTVFEGRVHRDYLDRFFKIFTDVLLEPRFDPQEFERLRTDGLNAIRNGLRGEDDETLGKTGLDELLYSSHPYAHAVGGTVQGLTSTTLEDVKAQARAVFTQDRLVVGLAGAADDALAQRVLARLSALPKTGAPRAALPPAPGVRGRVRIFQKDALSTAVSMGFATPVRRGDPDFFALAFAASYLGEHRQFTGVLMQELRDKRGMNYGDYAYAEHFLQGEGTFAEPNVGRAQQDFSIWLRPVEPSNAMFATRGALYFLDQLITKGPDVDRFETVRGFLLGYTRLWEQTDQRRLGYAIDSRFYGTPKYLDGYRQALSTLTPAQVRDALQRNWRIDHLNAVYIAKDAQDLAKMLAAQAPSPIVYPSPKAAEVVEVDKAIATQKLPFNPALIEVRDAQTFMEK